MPEERNVSVSQTGTIPNWANSIKFLVNANAHDFTVAMNGNPLYMQKLTTSGSYATWGADASAYVGQTVDLRFTSQYIYGTVNPVWLDDIQFSTDMVPEPSALALLCGGGMVCLWMMGWRRKPGIQHNDAG
ncbi:MAG: PEP-CTERM sorting domain-containing protein [Verrucomicrobiota bacterium]